MIHKYNLEILIIFFLVITSVAAFQANSTTYNVSSKMDFGATNNASSSTYTNRFISGFQTVSRYVSSTYNGRFGILPGAENVAPKIVGIIINSTDGSNRTLQDLHCSATLTDNDFDSMNITVQWYQGSTAYLNLNYTNQASGTFLTSILKSGNTTKNQKWSCSMMAFDGNLSSSLYITNNLTILNSPPSVTLTYPTNGMLVTNNTPQFNWTTSDDDGDTSFTYDFNISLIAASLCTDTNQFVEDFSSNQHTLTSALNCFYDNGDYYIWSARAKDGESTGNWANYFNVNLSALVDISLPTNSVSFGNLPYLGSNNTTNNSPPPFSIQNNGNSLINVNISATDLWNIAPNPTDYYKLKVDNFTGEEGAFNWSASSTSWTNTSETNNSIIIYELNYVDSIDTAEIDIYVEIPVNETPTVKSSIVTFLTSFAE